MTENKRFEIKVNQNNHFAYAHSGYQAEKIIQELNELVETNRELYKENKELKSKIKDLKFENEKKYRNIVQLEQMLQDVER